MQTNTIKQPKNQDPFLQRAIEYWLDSVNELTYQPLFCEWLTTLGHVLKYSIKNTNFELGKDVVSVDQNKIPHAYQLKGGNINLKRWRNEVKPEIEVLIDCPIQHPDINKDSNHVSYLVTNGEIDDSVRVEIVALNEKKWKDNPLRVWTRSDLLNGFQSMAEGILPQNAEAYKRLIDLIFANGFSLPDMEKVNSFLCEILKISNDNLPKEQRKRDIAAGVLYATMVVGPYRKSENHTSVVHVLVLLLSLIFYLVDKYNLEDKYWLNSYEIVWNDILNTAKLLEMEIDTVGFDSSFTSPLDKDLMPLRKHSAIAVIYPLKLSQFIIGNDEYKTILAPGIVEKYKNAYAIWGGEASLLPFIMLSLISKNLHQESATINILETAILQILEFNGRKSKHQYGLMPPYYDIDFVVKLNYKMLEETFEDNYKFSSHLLKPYIEMMTRLKQRDFIAENWKEISFMHFEEFVPDDSVDYYLWRIKKGENLSIEPKQEKSWNELVTEANNFDGKTLPPTIKRFPEYLPFFLSIFPFRVNSEALGFLDKICIK
ncbi:hypothetical protein KKD57_05980 [Patescibacteria group bacterium]|nr:hypothetical protein [Patescibacteria group bacterium]